MAPYRPTGGANIKLLHDVKLWPRQYGIPSPLEYRVLCHLASDPESRAYIADDEYHISVSNAGGEPGWAARGTLRGMLSGCHYDRRPWLKLDKEASRRCHGGIKAYKITDGGFEAIAQYLARHRYEEAHLRLAKRLLEKGRTMARALRPT